MEIKRIEAFQMEWESEGAPYHRSAFVRVHTVRLCEIEEAPPMLGALPVINEP